jgi:hypothetical protein
MVIRDLTLRSAASFGSFHLIRLLYDEYMFYLIEHQVAEATGVVPIAVILEGIVSIVVCRLDSREARFCVFGLPEAGHNAKQLVDLRQRGRLQRRRQRQTGLRQSLRAPVETS